MRRSVPKLQEQFLKKSLSNPPPRLDTLLAILRTPAKERPPVQLQLLMDCMQSFCFFSELTKTVNADALLECCQFMTLEHFEEGEFVFHAEEEGRKFYVVLSGSVTVLRPEGRVDGKKMYQQLAVLKEGGSFGELALIQSSRRSASVLCREPTSLGVLMRQDYLRTVGKIQEQMLAKKVTLLQSNPVFAPWSRSSLLKFSYFFKERTFSRKQVLFRAGEAASEVFLVKSGDLELVKDISVPVRKSLFQLKDCDLRRQAEVMLVGVGDLLGGVEVLKEQLHRYTCVCHSLQAEVLSISRDDFLKRMTSEEAVKTMLAMSEAIEHKRGQRLQRVSDRERKTHDLSALLTSLADASLPGSVMHARMELEAEVRDRWFLPKLKKHGSPVPILTSVSPIESPKSGIFNCHHRATSELVPAHSFLKELRPGKSLKTLIAIMPNLSLRRKFLRRKAESCSRLDLDSPSAT